MPSKLIPALVFGAFASAASAQSSVTLGGIVDAWVGQTRHKVGVNPPGTGYVVDSGGAQASRWSLRGTEDLGDGLKASFVLEQGFALDSGTVSTVSASNVGFNRGAYLGVSGDFGDVRLGRMLGAFDALRGSTNHLYDSSGFASTGQVWGAGATAANGLPAVTGTDYLARGNNTVMYITPALGIFSGSVSFSANEGASTATESPRTISAHGKVTQGPLRVGYSYQAEAYTTGKNKFHLVAGNYNFGPVNMVGAFQRQIDERIAGHQTSNEWELGLDAPFGLATVAIGYASAKTENSAGRKVVDAHGLSLMATYDISKRTRLYTAFRQLKTARADGSTSLDASRLGFGVTHRF
ncbi:outer membrane porin protein 32 [Comamonadaceae bacterium OS-1]|nr:outer membrane porin protein 32 [Comamonadaceae bacterium OS-1]